MSCDCCEICTSKINFYTGDKMPCQCKTRYMHYSCLGEWIKTRKENDNDIREQKHMVCEICKTRYFNKNKICKYQWLLGDIIQKCIH